MGWDGREGKGGDSFMWSWLAKSLLYHYYLLLLLLTGTFTYHHFVQLFLFRFSFLVRDMRRSGRAGQALFIYIRRDTDAVSPAAAAAALYGVLSSPSAFSFLVSRWCLYV